jgi:hypothetical protein
MQTKIVLLSARREAVYQCALLAVEVINADLTSGRRYYRTRAGGLLTTLDEVVRAILADDLVVGQASKVGPMTAEDYRRIMRVVYRQSAKRDRRRRLAELAA